VKILYKLYRHKNLTYGFIVVCCELNPKLAISTVNSIKSQYGCPIVCTFPKTASDDLINEVKKHAVVYRGEDTFSSLLNLGLQKTTTDWNFVIVGGSIPRRNLDKKFCLFVENEKDVLFPIVDGKTNFIDATVNGLFLHRKIYEEVGELPKHPNWEVCKLFWALDAVDKGYKFKAIANSKFC
jgi:hypothetical protein